MFLQKNNVTASDIDLFSLQKDENYYPNVFLEKNIIPSDDFTY